MNDKEFLDIAAAGALYPAHVDTIRERHERALDKAGASHAVIFSNAPRLVFLDDYNYPFKANPHFVGWLPLTRTPFCYIVYTPGEIPRLIYYQEKDYWHTPPATPQGYWTSQFDIRVVHSLEDVQQHLPQRRDQCILIGEIHDSAHAFGIERINPDSAINILHYARSIKTDYELECMRAASRRAVAGHRAAETAFRAGLSEFKIHLAYCEAVSHTDNELPYGNIIALNENGAVMHYQHQAREVPAAIRSFLIDAGAQVHGYASDITRSYSYESAEFSDLITRFDQLQLELVGEVRAGLDFKELHLTTHVKIAELLNELGLAIGSAEALINAGVVSAFFPTGLGHLLGIQVHDVAGFMENDGGTTIDRPSGHPYLRLTRELLPNQVLTVEPGMYVIDLLLENIAGTAGEAMINKDRVNWLRPFGGVRIEDNIRVLEDGCENLTRDAFASSES